MVVAPSSESAQGWISATLDSAVAAGTTVRLTDASGATVASFETAKSAQNITFSSSAIASGESYSVVVGDSEAATVTAGEAPPGGGWGGGRS